MPSLVIFLNVYLFSCTQGEVKVIFHIKLLNVCSRLCENCQGFKFSFKYKIRMHMKGETRLESSVRSSYLWTFKTVSCRLGGQEGSVAFLLPGNARSCLYFPGPRASCLKALCKANETSVTSSSDWPRWDQVPWQLRLGLLPPSYSKQVIWKQCGAVEQQIFTKPIWGLTFYLEIQKSRSEKQN